METGVRGFIITGNDSYLEPYQRGKSRLSENLARLRTLTADNASQGVELDALGVLVSSFQNDLAVKIAHRKATSFEESYQSISDQRGRDLLDGIRASVSGLQNEELRLLRERENTLDTNLRRTVWIFIFGCSAGILAVLFANYLIFRETGRRRAAETALMDVNRDLERKVEDRTREISRANRDLQELADERSDLLAREKAAREEAEIATRLRDEFMATVSHELRTPINSILGWARMMRDGRLDQARTSKAVDTIIKNSETQNRLIADLMDVARVISGKFELERTDVDPFDLASTAVESIKPQAEAKGLSLAFEHERNGNGAVLKGDRDRLTQVLTNLLTNAVKFTPEGGHVRLFAEAGDGQVVFRVIDDGAGISPDFLPLVFERFRQDTRAARDETGLGLGLAIVRHLVEAHGGSVKVDSRGRGHGSTFTVELPLAS
jgi:signal transduction histidine kinase